MLIYLTEWMSSQLAEAGIDTGPLRLFQYLTFRMFLAAVLSFLLGLALGPPLIRRLREFKIAQVLRTEAQVGDLAVLHARKKNTPTMGGLLIFASLMVSALLLARPNAYVLTALMVYAGLTLIGFLDDLLKVTKRSSGGLPGKLKLLGQAALSLLFILALSLQPDTAERLRALYVPFLKDPVMAVMPLWFLFGFLFMVIAGSSNAINLTDGIDGLAIGCTITVALVYALMAYASGNVIISDYLLISFVPGSGELAVVCAALLGASMAFLWYNAHPAEVFMGDTGSLALGGLIGAIAFMIHQPLTLVIVGGIFVMEAASVIIQVTGYKCRGVRVFRMAPIHHHFELIGWPESKVVMRFWILSLAFALTGLATLKLR